MGSLYHATYSSYARGVSILVRIESLLFQALDVHTDLDGKYIILNDCIYDTTMGIVRFYLPPLLPRFSIHLCKCCWYIMLLKFCCWEIFPFWDLDRLYSVSWGTPDLVNWANTFCPHGYLWWHLHPTSNEFTCHSTTFKTLSRIDLTLASYTERERVSACATLCVCLQPDCSKWI